MRKLLLILFSMVVIGMLSGCSIPIGDGVLTISSDGIDFISGEGDTEFAEDDSDVLMNTPDEDMSQEEDEAEDQSDFDNEAAQMDENNQAQQPETAASSGMCNNPQDHSSLLNNIGEPFYFPECAVIKSSSLSTSVTDAELEIPNSNWQDVAAEYREELSSYDVTESSNFENESVSFSFKLDEEYWGTTNVNINQEENNVRLKVIIYSE